MITLKTLGEATPQQIYDQVKAHLLSQNAKSRDNVACFYRGPNGLKCAAGILIGDDEYKPEMDQEGKGSGSSWYSLIERGLVPGNHGGLINWLQQVHDFNKPEEWKSRLEAVAVEYNLVP